MGLLHDLSRFLGVLGSDNSNLYSLVARNSQTAREGGSSGRKSNRCSNSSISCVRLIPLIFGGRA